MRLDIDALVAVALTKCEARLLAPDTRRDTHPEDGSPWCWRGRIDLRFTIGKATVTKKIITYGRPPWPKGYNPPTDDEVLDALAAMDQQARHRIARHGVTPPAALPWRVYVGDYDDAVECATPAGGAS